MFKITLGYNNIREKAYARADKFENKNIDILKLYLSGEDTEMAKKIKFPLEMARGVQVRSLEELQENFDLEKVVGCYMNGKLLIWLKDRYYDDEAAKISQLNKNDKDLKQKICNIFGVKCTDSLDINIAKLEECSKRISKLKSCTDDEKLIENIDKVAFNQEELADLLDEGIEQIYLCGNKFTIPLNKENIRYIGVNNPTVVIKSETFVDFSKKNILFKGVYYNDEYQNVIQNRIVKDNEVEDKHAAVQYKASVLFDYMMKNDDRNLSSKIFDVINNKLSEFNYDIDKRTKNSAYIIKHANLSETFDNYLDRIS